MKHSKDVHSPQKISNKNPGMLFFEKGRGNLRLIVKVIQNFLRPNIIKVILKRRTKREGAYSIRH